MKKGEGYDLERNSHIDKVRFTFKSISEHQTIDKIVEFKKMSSILWNLGFGDISGDDWEDNIISNNNDLRKVLQTVVNAVYDFIDIYPHVHLLIYPLDYQRKLLYNRIFRLRWHEIEPLFSVKGFTIEENEVIEEDYTPKNLFDYFVIKPK